MKKSKLSLIDGVLLGLAGFGVGSLVTLVVNTIQTTKLKNAMSKYPTKPVNYNCKIQAVIEPEKEKKRISSGSKNAPARKSDNR